MLYALIEFGMIRLYVISLVLFSCGCFFEGCVTTTIEPESADVTQEQENPAINSELIKIQQDIVELRRKIFDDTQIKLENAQATLQELVDERAKLAEAKIKLAKFQDRDDLIIQELQNLVQFYINARGKLLEQLESGKGKGKGLYEIDIALMETNIRLSQAVNKIYPSGMQGQ
jgi:hypothetical protein